MNIDILTLFPEMFTPLEHSIIKRARDKNIININIYNIRDFTKNKHKKVDDYPYGGGCGMVMSPEPIYDAVKFAKLKYKSIPRIILMSPGGKVFSQKIAKELAKEEYLLFICGHYEGIDERIKAIIDDEISIGDYVLTGGELASMVIIDSVSRLVDGVLSSKQSYEDESFYNGFLEYPQYTRPEVFMDMKVPEILLSGHHEKIKKWRKCQAIKRTIEKRPDLINMENMSEYERQILKELSNSNSQ